jgi:hypothetical protein
MAEFLPFPDTIRNELQIYIPDSDSRKQAIGESRLKGEPGFEACRAKFANQVREIVLLAAIMLA